MITRIKYESTNTKFSLKNSLINCDADKYKFLLFFINNYKNCK